MLMNGLFVFQNRENELPQENKTKSYAKELEE